MDVTEPTKREPLPPLRRDDLAFIAVALAAEAENQNRLRMVDAYGKEREHKLLAQRATGLAMLFRTLANGAFNEARNLYAGMTEGA